MKYLPKKGPLPGAEWESIFLLMVKAYMDETDEGSIVRELAVRFLDDHPIKKLSGRDLANLVDYTAIYFIEDCSISAAAELVALRLSQPDGDLYKQGFGCFTYDAVLQAHKRYGAQKADILRQRDRITLKKPTRALGTI